MKICAIGGDARMPHAVAALKERGHEVTHTATGSCPLSPEALAVAEAVLLPYPASRDGETLTAPSSPLPVPLSALFSMIPEGVPVLCGRADERLCAAAGGHRLYDYAADGAFLEKNAAITAEGVIALLAARLSSPLFETPCLVLGSGRLARAVHERLVGWHVPTAAAARNAAARFPDGSAPLPLGALPAELFHYDVVINTVPVRLLTAGLVSRMRRGAILLELSAAKDVLDLDACRLAGVEVVTAPALPGRYAPRGAGRAIAEAAADILSSL
ncbi:MAG: hypothetical protein IKC73_06615 [Clostridia bacterium]|nr:hypothetical protein [Clostridia bacterium]